MAFFIKLKNTYNVLTTQGESSKYVNVEHIVNITEWSSITNSRIKSIKSRIKLSDGELLDVKESIDEIISLINNSRN